MTSSETLDLLANHLALFEVDMASGVIHWVSRTLETMFGYTIPGDLEGHKIETLIPDAVRERHAKEHRPAFAANPTPRLMGRALRLSGQRCDGSIFPVEVMLLPRAANRQRLVVGVVLDLSERVIQEKLSGSQKMPSQ